MSTAGPKARGGRGRIWSSASTATRLIPSSWFRPSASPSRARGDQRPRGHVGRGWTRVITGESVRARGGRGRTVMSTAIQPRLRARGGRRPRARGSWRRTQPITSTSAQVQGGRRPRARIGWGRTRATTSRSARAQVGRGQTWVVMIPPASSPTPSLHSPLAPCSRSVRLGGLAHRSVRRSAHGWTGLPHIVQSVCWSERERGRGCGTARARSRRGHASSRNVHWRGRDATRSRLWRGRASSWRTARSQQGVRRRERDTTRTSSRRVPASSRNVRCRGRGRGRERERGTARSSFWRGCVSSQCAARVSRRRTAQGHQNVRRTERGGERERETPLVRLAGTSSGFVGASAFGVMRPRGGGERKRGAARPTSRHIVRGPRSIRVRGHETERGGGE